MPVDATVSTRAVARRTAQYVPRTRRGKMEPVRTCLGCRTRADKTSLLRVVERDGVVVADTAATLPGRGAWVHPTVECIEASIRRKAFGRALRSTRALDCADLLAQVGVSTETPRRTG